MIAFMRHSKVYHILQEGREGAGVCLCGRVIAEVHPYEYHERYAPANRYCCKQCYALVNYHR